MIEKQQNPINNKIPEYNLVTEEIDIFDIIGMIDTVDTVPTKTPTRFKNQFKIYKNGTTKRFYWYDRKNKEWSYVSGT